MRPMLPDGRRLGAHLPLATGMVKAVDGPTRSAATALQIFTRQPDGLAPAAEPPTELAAFRERLARARHRAGRDPRLVPHQPRRPGRRLRSSGRSSCSPTSCAPPRRSGRGSSTSTSARIATPASTAGIDATSADAASARAAGRGRRRGRTPAMLVLENSPGAASASGRASTSSRASPRRSRPAASPRAGSASASTRRTPGAPASTSADAGGDRRLPRRRSTRASASTGWSWSTSTTRAPSAARARTATSTSAPGGSGRPGSAHVLRHPALAHATYYLETPGMDEGYDAINVARARALAARRAACRRCRRRRSSCAAAPAARTAPA